MNVLNSYRKMFLNCKTCMFHETGVSCFGGLANTSKSFQVFFFHLRTDGMKEGSSLGASFKVLSSLFIG